MDISDLEFIRVLGYKMKKNKLLTQPFLKWAGGKRQLLPEINKYMPQKLYSNSYFEPFVGAGALLFDFQPKNAVIGDINGELINCYEVIKDSLNDLLLELMKPDKYLNNMESYYQIRDMDRLPYYSSLSKVEKAARIIYLNKTCYNGLFRVNSQGFFNVPFGSYKNPKIVDEIVLKAVHHYLNNNQITILQADFQDIVKTAKKGDFVYFDPPYDPVSDTASFTGYIINGFGRDEQVRLKETFSDLDRRGCKVMLSNSATEFILELYREYQKSTLRVHANRSINSNAKGRGKIDEVLIMNY